MFSKRSASRGDVQFLQNICSGDRLPPPYDIIFGSHLVALAHAKDGAFVKAFEEYCKDTNSQTGQRPGAATQLISHCREEDAWLIPAVLGVCSNVQKLAEEADKFLVKRGQEARCQNTSATMLRKAFAAVSNWQ